MDTKVLTEDQKQQLDIIVHKMTRNKEKPEAIQYVVSDFKNKYGTLPAKEPGFGKKLVEGTKAVVKDIVGLEQNKSTSFIPSILRSTIGSQGLAGVAQLPGRVAYQAMNPDEEVITPKEALGTAANAALTAATSGTGSLAAKTGMTGGKALAARAVENAAIGGGFQASQNLVDEKPITEGLGLAAGLGAALPIGGTALSKGKKALLGGAESQAETVINSLIKPLQKDFAYGKSPARGILNEGITANSMEDLGRKVTERTTHVGERIGELGTKLEQSGLTLDLTPALAPIDEAMRKAAKSNNPTLLNSLNNVKIALMHDLQMGEEKGVPVILKGDPKNLISAGYNEAKQFLADIAEHTRFTGNPSDDKELNAATKKAYGIVREAMNNGADSVDKKLGVEIRDLNERYGDLLSAKSAINHRDIVLKRQNFLDLAQRFSIPVAVATGILTGNWQAAGAVLAAELTVKGVSSTAAKTRIAQFLSRLAPEERAGILNSTPVLKNLYERLTGNVEPEPGAKKTKILQKVEDFFKKPDLSGKASIGALGAGAAVGAGAALGSMGNETTYTAPKEEPVKSVESEHQKIKDEIAFRESGSTTEPYKAVNSSNKDGSSDYGKYQVNERTLKTYAKKFLGKDVTPEEFLASPELQEKFIDAALVHLKSLGAKSEAAFLALWHKGWGDVSAKRVAELKNDPGVKKYLSNKPNPK